MTRQAKVVAATDEVKERFIEVKILRKYVPTLCCVQDEDGRYAPKENEGADPNDKHPYQRQTKVVVGTAFDRRGQETLKYREVIETLLPGSIVMLPADEAQRAIKNGTATITDRSFG